MNSNCKKKAGYCSTVSYPSFTCILAFVLLFSAIGGGKALAQAECDNYWFSTGNIGIHAGGYELKKSLNIYSNPSCSDPCLRLQYNGPLPPVTRLSDPILYPVNYWGHLLIRSPFNSIDNSENPPIPYSNISTEKDLILEAASNAEDLILTTRSTSGSIRFSTTPPNSTGNDIERMTILPNGSVGIGTKDPYGIFTTQSTPNQEWGYNVIHYLTIDPANPNKENIINNTTAFCIVNTLSSGNWNEVFKIWGNGSVETNGSMHISDGSGGSIKWQRDHPEARLSVDGLIVSKEVRVLSDNWSDFVFDKDYKLTEINDLEDQIKNLGHLPGIPSSEEVKKDGVAVGEIQAKLLQKIEELTLYVIELKKEINTLKEQKENKK